MTKDMLAKELKKSGISYRRALYCIDTLFDSITEGLSQNENIELRGFGTFYIAKRASRKTSINGNYTVPEHGVVAFRPSEKLRRAVWNCVT